MSATQKGIVALDQIRVTMLAVRCLCLVLWQASRSRITRCASTITTSVRRTSQLSTRRVPYIGSLSKLPFQPDRQPRVQPACDNSYYVAHPAHDRHLSPQIVRNLPTRPRFRLLFLESHYPSSTARPCAPVRQSFRLFACLLRPAFLRKSVATAPRTPTSNGIEGYS